MKRLFIIIGVVLLVGLFAGIGLVQEIDLPFVPDDEQKVTVDTPAITPDLPFVPNDEQVVTPDAMPVSPELPFVEDDRQVSGKEQALPVSDLPFVEDDRQAITERRPIVAPELPFVQDDAQVPSEEKPLIFPDLPVVGDDEPTVTISVPITLPELPFVQDDKQIGFAEKPIIIPDLPFVADDQQTVTTDMPLGSPELPFIPDDKPSITIEKSPVSQELPFVPDDQQKRTPARALGSPELPLVPDDTERKEIEKPVVSPELPFVPDDTERKGVERPLNSPQLPSVPDDRAPTWTERPLTSPQLPSVPDDRAMGARPPPALPNIKLPFVEDTEIFDVQYLFNGEWKPNVESILVGAKDFRTLTNMRYTGRVGNTSIEGVQGYTKINSSALDSAIENGYQLKNDFTTKSYIIATTSSDIYEHTASVPATGDFAAYSIYKMASGASVGRFSEFPDGNVGYANGKESCIWAGDEMLPAGFYTFTDLATGYTSVTITGGATDEIIFTSGSDVQSAGFKPGQRITLSGSTTSNGDFTIYTMTTTKIHVVEDLTTSAVPESISITTVRPVKNIIDFTEAVQNELKTTGNIVPIGEGTDAVLLLHMDGSEGSTTLTDSSPGGHTSYTLVNGTKDTSTKKFGTASLKFAATADYADFADSADWFMGTGNFTVDFWWRLDTATSGYLFSQRADGFNYVYFHYSTGTDTFTFTAESATVEQWSFSGHFSPVLGEWNHIEVSRVGPTSVKTFINGAAIATATITAAKQWPDLAANFHINEMSGSGSVSHYDEFRVTKGTARHTSNFSVPSAPYKANQKSMLVLAYRPLQAVKTYVSEANTYSATMSGKHWTGDTFSTMTLIDSTVALGVSLAQTGTISFSSTVADAKQFFFQGVKFYAYLFELSAGYATIYFVTTDAAFQPIIDLWDGVYRPTTEFQVYDATDKKYADYTLEVNTPSTSAIIFGGLLDDFEGGSGHVVAMFDTRMTALLLTMAEGSENTEITRPAIEYWTGTTWTGVSSLNDSTTTNKDNWVSLSASGVFSWEPPETGEELVTTLFGSTGYAYSITFNNTLGGDVAIDTVYGIPVDLDVRPFKSTGFYKNRALLINFEEGKEANRIDYSVTGLPNTWNGIESSMNGTQSIFIGGNEGVTATSELFNRYDSNIYTILLVLKKTEAFVLNGNGPENFRVYSVSKNIGCPAPLTLVSVPFGHEISEGGTRNIIIWLSQKGPVYFDGSAIYRIPGIENYFDPSESEYIKTSLIAKSRGWFDQTNDEYNLGIPSGTSATEINTWLVWSRKYNKWYKKTPTTDYPQSGWPVYDTDNIQYIYAGDDNGYMLRLEDTTLWNTTPINHVWETGDFLPSKNMWDLTRLHRFKLIANVISEVASVSITLYTATATATGKSLSEFTLGAGSNPVKGDTQPLNELAWAHRVHYSVTMGDGAGAVEKALKPLMWGYRYSKERKDIY